MTGFPKSVRLVRHVWRFLKMSDDKPLDRQTECPAVVKWSNVWRDAIGSSDITIQGSNLPNYLNILTLWSSNVIFSCVWNFSHIIFFTLLTENDRRRKSCSPVIFSVKWLTKTWNVWRRTPTLSDIMSNELQNVFVKPDINGWFSR